MQRSVIDEAGLAILSPFLALLFGTINNTQSKKQFLTFAVATLRICPVVSAPCVRALKRVFTRVCAFALGSPIPLNK